jgi:uncharacterized membrane protein
MFARTVLARWNAMLAVPATLPQRPLSLRAAFQFAWRALWQRFGLFAAILLTFGAAWVILEVVVIGGQRFGIGLWAVAHLAFLIFFAGLEAGFARMCLDLYDRRTPTFTDAFARLALGPMLVAGQIIYLLLVVIGLALLVVPGLYLASRFSLFAFCLVDDQPSLIDSFRHSAALSNGTLGQLALLSASLFLLNVLGACVLGLGLFVTIPLSVLMLAAVYRQLTPLS